MKIKELLDNRSKWTQDASARNAQGECVDVADGTCWCLLGALAVCYEGEAYTGVYRRLQVALGTLYVASWNDDPKRTFDDVKNLVTSLDV